jgi:DNA-binding LytR/AlgR family response regulator
MNRFACRAGAADFPFAIRPSCWHVAGKEFLNRASLTDLAEKLDSQRFIRIHRSAIVNIESILQLEPAAQGNLRLS